MPLPSDPVSVFISRRMTTNPKSPLDEVISPELAQWLYDMKTKGRSTIPFDGSHAIILKPPTKDRKHIHFETSFEEPMFHNNMVRLTKALVAQGRSHEFVLGIDESFPALTSCIFDGAAYIINKAVYDPATLPQLTEGSYENKRLKHYLKHMAHYIIDNPSCNVDDIVIPEFDPNNFDESDMSYEYANNNLRFMFAVVTDTRSTAQLNKKIPFIIYNLPF